MRVLLAWWSKQFLYNRRKEMRKLKFILSLMLIPLINCGCKKNPFDYRTKYLGNYVFVVHSSSYNPTDGAIDTTYTLDGKIDYGSDKNTILITSNGITGGDYKIYEDGTVETEHCSGEFATSDKLLYSCYIHVSMMAKWSWDVVGEKK